MFIFLTILGSLGVFLFGMKVMSEGIQKTAGERMRYIMATMTKNRFAALFTGFFTTCLMQSSSVTTVITVSFVNAGLLTLRESIGVIMGANLGTTLTAWIIAFVPKFDLGGIALPLIGLGIPPLFIGKGRPRSIGESLVGFGLVFLGLALLRQAVPDVRDAMENSPEFAMRVQSLVTSLSGYGLLSVLLFVALGTILTICVQSSSAAMAITITLAANGWIGFDMSAAIVLGENIGTTVTAWLASLGASANAKRTARAHLLFNVIGVAWMLCVFPFFVGFIEWLAVRLPESLRANGQMDSDLAMGLALFHSMFNLVNIALLIGFTPLLTRIVMLWVKAPGGETFEPERLRFISQGIVDVGELNLPEAENAIRRMAALNQEMMDRYIKIFQHPSEDRSSDVEDLRAMERLTDTMLSDITTYLVRSSTHQLDERHAHSVAAMLQVVSEMEQVADCISRLVKLVRKKYRSGKEFDPEVSQQLLRFAHTIQEFITFYRTHLFRRVTDADLARAQQLEEQTDQMRKALRREATARMREGEDVETELLNIDLGVQMERIGNHALNIVEEYRYIDSDESADTTTPPPQAALAT
ncbi:MAG: Na/Pi cotransporter family protein [Thermoguttaceae bacterium]|jgi:phosphate:Na+ symporter|nr:Na/Pi cotransporter family protein [Thermoguttaceae bacterium]